MSELGKRIRELRVERELSQEELAFMVGVHQTKISHIEIGYHELKFPLAIRLAKALGVTVNDLVPDAERTVAQV